MKFRWPPGGLGLGTPFNSALTTKDQRRAFARSVWLPLLLGVITAGAMIGLDQRLFAGASLERVRALGQLPLLARFGIVVYSAVTEETVYRLGLATLVAWLALSVLRRDGSRSPSIAIWISIVVTAFLFGLAHVGNTPTALHPFLRAITLNGMAGIVLGWLYWRRGFEAAVAAHFAADAFIYIVLARIL
jgi:membrane protease YdiL (CAAX protease family)